MNKITIELTDNEAACFYGILAKEIEEWRLLGEGGKEFHDALKKVYATKPAHIIEK